MALVVLALDACGLFSDEIITKCLGTFLSFFDASVVGPVPLSISKQLRTEQEEEQQQLVHGAQWSDTALVYLPP